MISLFVLLFSLSSVQAAPVPPNHAGSEFGLDIRIFKKIEQTTLMAEHVERDELDSLKYRRTNLGAYQRLHRNLKAGLFYWNEQGNRRDEDWRKIDNVWQWQAVNHEQEHSIVLDLTPVTELPLENLLFEWKNRFMHNLNFGRNLVRTRPGLTYIVFYNDRPLVNLFHQYEFYLPLDYGRKRVYETWIYFGSLFHVSKNFLIGPYYSKRTRFWLNTDQYSRDFGNEYVNKFQSNFFGLTMDFLF